MPTKANIITDIRNKLLEFNLKTKNTDNIYATSMYLDIDSFDSNESETKFRSIINKASRNKVDFPEGLKEVILKNHKRFFKHNNYDNQAKSLLYYASYNPQEKELDEYLIFSKINVNEYISIGKNFDISILDELLFEIRDRLIIQIDSEKTDIYNFDNYILTKKNLLKNRYAEARKETLDFAGILPKGKGASLKISSVHSSGQRREPEVDIYREYSKDIVSEVKKILSQKKYYGIYLFFKSEYSKTLEKNLVPLSKEVEEYIHHSEYIDIDENIEKATEKILSLIRNYRERSLKEEISSAKEQNLLLTEEGEIVDAANEARIEKLLIVNQKQGPAYLKNLLKNYPIKGSTRINSMKNAIATKVYEYGGTVVTLPKDSAYKMAAILRRNK